MEFRSQNEVLVENIRQLCKASGSSITKLEASLGYANGSIGKWAKAKRSAPYNRIQEIADELGVSPDLLYGKEDITRPGNVLSKDELEVIRLFRAADLPTQAAMLQLLRFAEAGRLARDADVIDK